jgi:hypothetical protein
VLTGHKAGVPLRIVGLLASSGERSNERAGHEPGRSTRRSIPHARLVRRPVIVEGGPRTSGRPRSDDRTVRRETVADAQVRLSRAQQGFAGIAFLFGLVALVVGSFLVANTLAMTLSEQTREIGLLRAAGLTARQVVGLFLRQGAAVGVIGSAIWRGSGSRR